MMKRIFTFLFTAVILFTAVNVFGQGSTTSAINGQVISDQEPLTGATVVAIHTPTGSQFGTITDEKGFYRIPNMMVGGPYKVSISFIGYQNYVKEGVHLTLGQTYRISADLKKSDIELEDIVVTALANDVFDGNKTGAETFVGEEQISVLPTVSRSISDFTLLTPQASVDDMGGISFAGVNNRYNSISIDGAVNNDVFGLSATGTNGGQTGGTPISIDAIKQFQIVMAPYDVRQGGFAGGGVNAVTRNGTNKFDGSVYYYYRNEDLAGKTPTAISEEDREQLEEFSSKTYGFRLGGPIIKDKLFFFVNTEIQRDQTPQPFDFSTYTGDATVADLQALSTKLNGYGYDPGGYLNNTRELNSDKLLVRLDWNINKTHKLTLRHSYTKNESIGPGRSSSRTINFYNGGVYFPSTTNSTALELKSNWNTMSNNLIVGYTKVFDDRDPMGGNFPRVFIRDGAGSINFGSEAYSTGNQLKQNVFTITDNFNIYKGKHTITIGTNNEFYSTYNLFIRQNYGEYDFDNLQDFLNDQPSSNYERSYSLVDNVTGDGSAAAAEFKSMQLGFYVQDEYQVNDNFKLTAGLRLDIPLFIDDPRENTLFNNTTIPLLEAGGYDLKGIQSGKMPKSQLMFAPRIGFNWDITGDQKTQVRGGLGIFNSRVPLVWPGGAYNNSGYFIGGVRESGADFRSDWNNQYTEADFGGTDVVPSGQMDLFVDNFKFPQVLRTSLAVDQKLPFGIIGTLEGMFTKTLNNMLYHNYNMEAPINMTGGPDTRLISRGNSIDNTYGYIMVGDNTSEGYSYTITAQLQKPFANGFTANASYTYGDAKSINDGLSSQNSSQWQYVQSINGRNNLQLAPSSFGLGHRIMAHVSYKIDYLKHASTTISMFYNGQSGDRYSYVYDGSLSTGVSSYRSYDLIWVPANQSQINLVDIGAPGDADYVSADAQWADLNDFIENDDYLSERRGDYAERYGARLKFEHRIDLKLVQDFYITAGERKHTLQFTFDIFNFANLLNADWGVRRYIPAGSANYDGVRLIGFEGYEADGTTPQYTFEKPSGDIFDIDDSGLRSSRWQAQFGIRYIF